MNNNMRKLYKLIITILTINDNFTPTLSDLIANFEIVSAKQTTKPTHIK